MVLVEDDAWAYAAAQARRVARRRTWIPRSSAKSRERARVSLTGHLVLSTLHTNDSIGAIVRLVDMGIEPYLAASCMIGTVA